jgi:hypothetical protein
MHDIFDSKAQEEHEPQTKAATNLGAKPPVLFSQGNEWRGKKMMPLISFLKLFV